MDTLSINESIFEPRDFFISHKQHDQYDQELVDPVVKELKERGYRIWYDKDTWGTEPGKEEEWEKRGIEQARHCVVILCQDYFNSKACRYELEYMLSHKDKNYIHSIWWTDITKEFLTKDALGKQLLGTTSIQWNKGQTDDVVHQLVEHANSTEGPQTYNGMELVADEARMMHELESILNEPIPIIGKNGIQPTFGFGAEKGYITILVLQAKKLNGLPNSFGQLQHLHQLTLQGNPLKALPPSFKTVHKHLIPRYPEVVEAESVVLGLLELLLGKKIPKVNIIKADTFGFTASNSHVMGLGLCGQALTSLPESFVNLVYLQWLSLDNNQLTSLPETFGNLTQLEKIWLSHNRLLSLPTSFGNLVRLQSLEMWGNHLISIPESLGNLTNLEELNLGMNQLRSLPEVLEHLTNLQDLDLNDNQLMSLPEVFGNLKNLNHLTLKNNQLRSLPESFGNLVKLRFLFLWNNRLSALPETFFQLTNLQHLGLMGNQLTSIPGIIGNLTQLEHLDLANNQLRSLPEAIGHLTTLQSLFLNDNQLMSLPEVFGNLKNLNHLALKNNQLRCLPKSFGNLKSLRELYVDKELASLPAVRKMQRLGCRVV